MDDFDDDLNLDLTPLIDVIFMLIIFFLMTMSFTLSVSDIKLPKAEGHTAKLAGALQLTADKNGKIEQYGKVIVKEDLATLLSTGKYQSVLLIVDKDAPVQVLIDVSAIVSQYAKGNLQVAVQPEAHK